MDVITYAKNNNLPVEKIPPSNLKTGIITSYILRKSRERVSVQSENEGAIQTVYENVSVFSDADCPRISYGSPYDDSKFITYANSKSNILDKILLLNPKQIGVINEFMDQVFDYGNQIHYLTAKYNIVKIFTTEERSEINAQTSLGSDKLSLVDSIFTTKNKRLYSYGDLSLNNMIFSSLLSSFNISGYESDFLYKSRAPVEYYGSSSFFSLPFSQRLTEQTGALDVTIPSADDLLTGSQSTGSDSPFGDISFDSDVIYYNQFKSLESSSIQSPFFVSINGDIFNEKMQVDITSPVWLANSIRIEKDNHYNSVGSDISYKVNDDAMSTLDTLLTRIYSWKSCLVVFEKTNRLSSDLFNSSYEYALLVGIKTRKYKIIDKIDKLFYIHIGDNYINNDKFSKKDIFLLNSSLRTMLKTYKADRVHFFDLSSHVYGNVCPNGLLFGIDTEVSNQIVDFVNKNDDLFIKVSDKIENIYELFESI
jgi:hypothetical protein